MTTVRLISVLTAAALWGTAASAREPEADVSIVATPAAVAADASAGAVTDAAQPRLTRELRTVEEEVTSLKERVFRSKATLKLLEELVVDSSISGARLVLWHENKLGGGYSLEAAQYFIDGRPVYTRTDPAGSLNSTREIKLWDQALSPGPHTLQVDLVLRGNGYKVFSYLRDYQFNVSSSYAFDVEEGRISVLRVIADSRGALYSFEERPTVRYDEHIENYSEE